jgi:hypothetical protein
MRLTPNFALEEFTRSQTAARHDIDNTPSGEVISNLIRVSRLLEDIRSMFDNRPIHISSGYRCPELNQRVGGSPKSQHLTGSAVDFTIQGVPLNEIMDTIIASGLPYDQLIHEFSSWIHCSVPNYGEEPRRQALIIDKEGTRPWQSHS